MKLAAVLIPIAIVLAFAGALMYRAGTTRAAGSTDGLITRVRHPVTEAMLRATWAMSRKSAPYFKVQDAHGKPVQIGGSGTRPQFIYFILKGCPCSIEAQLYFNRVYDRFHDQADVIGVINTDGPEALDFAGESSVLGPIVADKPLTIIHAFGAKESTYSVLIGADGTIEKMWPGYSSGMLEDLNARLSKMTHAKARPLDVRFAPPKLESGCFF